MPETNEVFVDYEKYLKRYVSGESLVTLRDADCVAAGTSFTR